MSTEYRIEYSIKRQLAGEEDFTEIGFGAADSTSIDNAEYLIGTDIQRRSWETEAGMPDPETIDRPSCE